MEWVDERMERGMDGMGGWKDRWRDGRMDERMDGMGDKWVDG